MKNNLLIATHGNLAEALKETAGLIFGEPKGVDTLTLKANMQVDDFRNQISDYIEKCEGENVLVLVDILSGSPFNCMIPFLEHKNVYLVTGVSLPMVLEVAMQKDYLEFNELCDLAKNAGKNSIITKDDILKLGGQNA